jgi:D-alanyl-D-alanine carboxypeptidase
MAERLLRHNYCISWWQMKLKLWWMTATLFAGAPMLAANPEPPTVESTPRHNSIAEQQLRRYLDAFNSGDRIALERFFSESTTPELRSAKSVDHLLEEWRYLGPFTLTSVGNAGASGLSGTLAAADMELAFSVEVEVEPGEQGRLSRLNIVFRPQPPIKMSDRDLLIALESKLKAWSNEGRFSGTVLLARRGRVIFSRAYGLADRISSKPNTLGTRFRIGSVNKLFTAIAILQLVESGRISLQDTVGKHVPDLTNREIADKVTIHQLLTHTGGTGDFFGTEYDARRQALRTLEDYLALDPMRKLEFEPGTRCQYSNYGYVLLGLVIERVTGDDYHDYIRKRIFTPAGMQSSGSPAEDEKIANRARGYTRPLGTTAWLDSADTLPMRASSAGGGVTTTQDLFRFARALSDGKLLNAEGTRQLMSVQVPRGDTCPTPFAYGLVDLRDADENGWVGLNGGAEGQNAHWKFYPKSAFTIAVLANLDLPAADRVAEFVDRHLTEIVH